MGTDMHNHPRQPAPPSFWVRPKGWHLHGPTFSGGRDKVALDKAQWGSRWVWAYRFPETANRLGGGGDSTTRSSSCQRGQVGLWGPHPRSWQAQP